MLEAYGSSIYRKAKDLAVSMGIAEDATPERTAAENLIAHIRKMNQNMGIPAKISGIQTEDIPQLAAYAHKEANPLYPVPRLMTRSELEALYDQFAEESEAT